MTVTQLTADPSASFVTVTCRLGQWLPDAADVGTDPDLWTLGGTVVLTSSAPMLRYLGGTANSRMVMQPSATFTIRPVDGALVDAQGVAGVRVVDPLSVVHDPTGWTYTARVTPNVGAAFSVTFGGESALPATVNLPDMASITPSAGESTLEQRVAALEATGGGGGVTDHGALTGLADDDHSIYHTNARGDLRYPPIARQVIAGTGLSGGGSLAADRTLTVAYGSSAGSAAQGNDARLSDQRVPTDSSVTNAKVAAAAAISLDKTADSATRLAMTSAERTKLTGLSGTNTGDQTLASLGAAPATQTINAQTGTTYTLQASDAGKVVTLTNAAAITLTVPGSVFTAGQRVDCLVLGAGMVTSVGSSCTVNGTPSLVSRAQYSAFTVLFTSATTAVLVGDLA